CTGYARWVQESRILRVPLRRVGQSSPLRGLPSGLSGRVSGKSVDEFVRLALSLVYPSECCIVSHTTELLDSTQKAHFSQFRQPVCHTPCRDSAREKVLFLPPGRWYVRSQTIRKRANATD